MESMTDSPILQLSNVSKRFGAVQALDDVAFELNAGEVRALLGKNGAGKSTLVNIISGAHKADSGSLKLNGQTFQWSSPAEATEHGVGVVHQELSLVPFLSVGENISMGRWKTEYGFIKRADVVRTAKTALDAISVDIPVDMPVSQLSLAQQQQVEIAKALVFAPRVLILDEPTSALNVAEASALLTLVRKLAAGGVAIIYVSHRMQEIHRVADSLTILRDGKEIATLPASHADIAQVASMVSGEAPEAPRQRHSAKSTNDVVLKVSNLSRVPQFTDISFDVHKGEVVGLAGLQGSGRTEILESIFGSRHDVKGSVEVLGSNVTKRTPRKMLALGVGMSSEDRKAAGIVPVRSVLENLMFTARGRTLPKIWIRSRSEGNLTSDQIDSIKIKTASAAIAISSLSGGNQQKVVIGRLLASGMQLLLLDEPTRGVDVQAKQQLYAVIRKLAAEGVATVFVSSELEELAEVCDRVLIIGQGKISKSLSGTEITPERVLTDVMIGD